FDIAEKDLALRGPGQFFGMRQSGLPDITMANIANVKLIEISKKYSDEILQNDPDLKNNPLLAQEAEYLKKNTHLE
ncbi:MAG TPA: DNA helicase RecG, partial [Candidatus Moranbacteria bacterium]|nr:DNA helicase RecG [Candidatus Moranbacteria bacterium]